MAQIFRGTITGVTRNGRLRLTQQCGSKRQQQPAVLALRQRVSRRTAGRLSAFFGTRTQVGQIGVVRKDLLERFQRLGEEDIPVARAAKLRGQRFPARRIHLEKSRCEQRGEKTKRGTQPTDGHARLVDVFRIVAGNSPRLITL